MNIGCHAVLFTDQIVKDTENLLTSLEKTGAQGLEIGLRFMGTEQGEKILSALDQHHLQLAGLHTQQLLTDFIDNPAKCEEGLTKAAQFMQHNANKNIIMTGMVSPASWNEPNLGDDRLVDAAIVKTIAHSLNQIAGRILKTYGVQIHYHNHNWEFKNDGLIIMTLLADAPDVCFALDTGWAAVSGYDPVQLIQSQPKRFRYIHLRDFSLGNAISSQTFEDLQNGYLELGSGDMDYPRLLACLEETLGEDGWAIVEYEKGAVDPDRYTQAIARIKDFLTKTK